MYYKGYHWPHLLFFSLTPFLAVAGMAWVVWNGGPHWGTWILAVFFLFATGIAVSGGYHRLFSHKSYRASWPVRLFYLLLGAGAFQGSARWWACSHRNHHRYVDTEKDPYGINKGFWHAHIGWLFTKDQDPDNFDNVADLDGDPLVRFQHRFFLPLALLIGFALPTGLASLWGDPSGGFLVAGLTRMVVSHHATFCINSVCHTIGKQKYSNQDSARDSWISVLLTFGEGYHNYHHTFPYDYRNGIKAYHWDPTKWVIRALAFLRLTTDLRRVPSEQILLAKQELAGRPVQMT